MSSRYPNGRLQQPGQLTKLAAREFGRLQQASLVLQDAVHVLQWEVPVLHE